MNINLAAFRLDKHVCTHICVHVLAHICMDAMCTVPDRECMPNLVLIALDTLHEYLYLLDVSFAVGV